MTFLPIVERELRVSARKRSTFWLRVAAGLFGIVVGAGCLTMFSIMGQGSGELGSLMFGMLTWMSFVAALASGIFFTSDSLSEEKREGTLGFLFLTDLRGYDVAGGKLLATSIRGSYAFLAVLPMLAATLLMGGVTGTILWKTSLALINALIVSLAAGLLISAMSRESQKAMAGTLLLLLVLMLLGPAVDLLLTVLRHTRFNPIFSITSAAYAFVLSSGAVRGPYWQALLLSHAMAWAMFGLASLSVPRAWQEKQAQGSTGASRLGFSWKYGGPKRRARLRSKLIDLNPVMWLACRERWQSLGMWVVVAIPVVSLVAMKYFQVGDEFSFVWSFVTSALMIGLYVGAASQASRFFVEARRSGMMELLLAAPMNGRQIALGNWRAVVRMLGPPIGIMLVVNLIGVVLAGVHGGFASAGSGSAGMFAVGLISGILGLLTTAGNFVALIWFGMWMGMTSKSANFATLKTLVFVQVAPWLAISFISTLGVWMLLIPSLAGFRNSTSSFLGGMNWYPLVMGTVVCFLSLGKDAGFALWAKGQLYNCFRERASMFGGMHAITQPIYQPTAAGVPPPIIDARFRA
jgi:hypothetical protein